MESPFSASQEHIEINPPLREDNPRIPSPWGDEIFYYAQVDLIKEANKGKSWKWCEVRPDQIVGAYPYFFWWMDHADILGIQATFLFPQA